MADLRVELVGVDFPRHDLIGCFILLFLDGRTLQLYGRLSLRLMLLREQNSSIVCALV